MVRASSYPVEDFLEAITAQLDKTQDALRLKAINRPLTFALKDFELDLKVFVEMDADGQIRFRPSGPNEAGASTVRIGFTTITRPMIEENTISLEQTQSPTLDEVGLEPQEQKRLERLGVRNAVQLRRLEEQAGDNTLSRMSGVNLAKLRQVLQLGRPHIDNIAAEPIRNDRSADNTTPGAVGHEPTTQPPSTTVRDGHQDLPGKLRDRLQQDRPVVRDPGTTRTPIRVERGTPAIRLKGGNLIGQGQQPAIRLNKRPLQIARATEDEVQVKLPADATSGVLSVVLPDGAATEFDLLIEEPLRIEALSQPPGEDPWLPGGDKLS